MTDWIKIEDNCVLPDFGVKVKLEIVQQITALSEVLVSEAKGMRVKYLDDYNVWGWDIENMFYRRIVENNGGTIFSPPLEIRAWSFWGNEID
jgi:hypothetical protein